MNKCVFNTIFTFNTLFMALKFIYIYIYICRQIDGYSPDLPENSRICTIDVVALYPNISIPNEKGPRFLRNILEKRSSENISTDTLIELAELALKNTYKKALGCGGGILMTFL